MTQTHPSIHTSDRILYRRCRRKWGWQSHLRGSLSTKEGRPDKNLWFGSGWHFALEDYHGYKRFPSMSESFASYVHAFLESERPYEWEELLDLGMGMADYYVDHWLTHRNEFTTLWLPGNWQSNGNGMQVAIVPYTDGAVPQVEVPFSLLIPNRTDGATFDGTLDAVVVDPYGRWWVVEYKTASRIDLAKLDTDPQVNAYMLAAAQYYQHPIEGVVYMQFLKDIPKPPKHLKDGELSQDKRQSTTHGTYRTELLKMFGSVPARYHDFLNGLLDSEEPEGNRFIRRDLIHRNDANIRNEMWKLQAETSEMLNPDLPLYPNPTRDCAYDCPFKGACLAMDDDADWQSILESEFAPATRNEAWRRRLTYHMIET